MPQVVLAFLRGFLLPRRREVDPLPPLLDPEPVCESGVPRGVLLKVVTVVVVAVKVLHLAGLDALGKREKAQLGPPDGGKEASVGVKGVQGVHLRLEQVWRFKKIANCVFI